MMRALLVILLFAGFTLSAQPNETQSETEPVDIEGVEILLIGGALFGVKKIHDFMGRDT